MDIQCSQKLRGSTREKWLELLRVCGLDEAEGLESTVLVWDEEDLVAAGSRQGNILKCIAVDPARQGEGLTGTLLTQLRQDAFQSGHRHLFLYTKPKNQSLFEPLFFYPVAKTDRVLLMESESRGLSRFLASLDKPCTAGTIGAAVMNCNPFTRGHRYLIEQAASQCDWLYIFVLSEEHGPSPAADRLALVRAGTADLPNVTVHPTGPYLISSATFPTYFLKDKASAGDVQCLLDIDIFLRHFVPAFSITRRYVGTEPTCPVTGRYNRLLGEHLPPAGVELRELERMAVESGPVSASTLRALLGTGQESAVRALVPDTTFQYLKDRNMI